MVASTTAANGPIEVGLFVPPSEVPYLGGISSWNDLVAFAFRAEALGFDSLWLADHLLLDFGPDKDRIGPWDCWSLLAALAAATSRMELGPLVSCTGYRNPAMLTKMADTAEEISGGRLILGLGAGWHESEFLSFGFPYDHRVSRFEVALQIIVPLLRGEHVDVQRSYYRAQNCQLRVTRMRGTRTLSPIRPTRRPLGRCFTTLPRLAGRWGVIPPHCYEQRRSRSTCRGTAGRTITGWPRGESRVSQPPARLKSLPRSS